MGCRNRPILVPKLPLGNPLPAKLCLAIGRHLESLFFVKNIPGEVPKQSLGHNVVPKQELGNENGKIMWSRHPRLLFITWKM